MSSPFTLPGEWFAQSCLWTVDHAWIWPVLILGLLLVLGFMLAAPEPSAKTPHKPRRRSTWV